MKNRMYIKIPTLLGMLLCFYGSMQAQTAEAKKAPNEPTQSEIQAKTAHARNLGLNWSYGDGESVNAAKSEIQRKQEMKATATAQNPDAAVPTMTAAGYVAPVTEITAEEYRNLHPARKQWVDANSQQVRIVTPSKE